MALSTLPEESRLAIPLASAGKVGISASQPFGQLHGAEWKASPPPSSGILLLVRGKQRHPFTAKFAAARAKLRLEILAHFRGNQKLRILRPAIAPLGGPDLLLPKGFTMRRAGVLFGRRAIADVAIDNDQRRPVCRFLEVIERFPQQIQVIRIGYPFDVPSVSKKASRNIFGECQTGMTLDGDVVVVVDPTQIGESQVPGQRGGLSADALHHATVSRQGIDIVVKERKVRLVVAHRKPVACQRHAHARCHPLTERSRRRFDPGGPAIFGMSRTSALQLPKILQVSRAEQKARPGFHTSDLPPSRLPSAGANTAGWKRDRPKG